MCSSHSPSGFVKCVASMGYEASKVILEHTVSELNISMHSVDDSLSLGGIGFGILLLMVQYML